MQRRLDRTIDLIKAAYPSWTKEADLLSFQLLNKQALEAAALEMTKLKWSSIYISEYPNKQNEALIIQTMPSNETWLDFDAALVTSRLKITVKVTSNLELSQIFVYLGRTGESSHKANLYAYADYLQEILNLGRVLYPAEIGKVVFDQTYIAQAQSRIVDRIETALGAPIAPLLLILGSV
jgi:uncharacterized protein YihD (DUF1040 family)